MFIVMIGNIVDGIQFVGPFDTEDKARFYGEECGDEWVCAEVNEA